MSSSTPLNSHPQDAVAGHNVKSGVGALQHAAGIKSGEQHLIDRGYVPVRQLTGKVVGVWGDAHIRLLDGEVKPLHVGDVVKKGEVVLTAQDGIVQIEASHTQLAGAPDDVERIISQVGQGDADVAPAAGPNSGGAAGSLEEGLRVDRDSESVTPAAQGFGPLAVPTAQPQAQAVAPLASGPTAKPDTETTAANTPIVFDPRGNDTSSSGLTIVAVAGHAISPDSPVTLPQGVVTMNADGSLTFTPAHGQSGTISFTYTETNATGGSATSTITVNVAPEPPPTAAIGLQHDTQNDTGVSATDSLTSNTHPVLDGSGQPDSTVRITLTPAGGTAVAYNAITDASGHWSLDLSTATPASGVLPAGGLPDGAVVLGASTTNDQGVTATATGTMTVDTTPPGASIDLTHDGADDTGTSSTDGVTANPHPVLVGTGEPNSTVTVTVTPNGGTPITYAVPTDASGHWSVDTATATPSSGSISPKGLSDGPVALQVVSTDAAGNSTTASGSFTEDHTPPAATIDLKHDGAADTGASNTDGITAAPHPVIVGTGEPGSTVTVTVTPTGGTAVTYSVPTDANGNWAIDTGTTTPTSGAIPLAGLPDGPVALQVVSTDGAGNTTTATGSFTEDRTPPAASIDLRHDGADDTGASSTDGLTANPHPVLVGTGEPHSTATITLTPNGGTPITYAASTDASGNWSVDTSAATPTSGAMPAGGLPDGPVALQVVSTDVAGNTTSATGSFTEDRTPPVASIDLKHDGADDTGASNTDGVTGNPHPAVPGTGEPSSVVTVTVTPNGGSPVTYSVSTDANGNWAVDTNTAMPTSGAIPVGGLPDGQVALQVVSTDAAGNTTTGTGSFTEDRTAPATPTIGLQHDSTNDTGVSATDNLTHNVAPVLVGSADANTAVTISVTDSAGNNVTYDTTTDSSGNWSIDTATAIPAGAAIPISGLPDGSVTLKIDVTDPAGNTASGSGSFEEVLSATATVGLKHDATDDTGSSINDGITNKTEPVITGTGPASTTLTVTATDTAGTKLTYSVTTDASGNWSIDTSSDHPTSGTLPAAGFANGNVALGVIGTDVAGNPVSATGSFTELLSSTATVGLKHDAIDDTGRSSTDSVTSKTEPVIIGTGPASTTLTVTATDTAGTKLTYSVTTDASGNWSIDTSSAHPTSGAMPASGFANGGVTLVVSGTDAAGNPVSGTGSFQELLSGNATVGLKHDLPDDSGASSTDSITNKTEPVITGTGPASTTLTVTAADTAGTKLTYSVTTDPSGNWAIDTSTAHPTSGAMPGLGFANGSVALTVSGIDVAGNNVSGSGSFQELLPTTATVGLKHDPIDDTGTSSTDGLTNKTEPVITGTGPASTTLTVTATDTAGTKLTYSVTTDPSGNWSVDTSSAHPTSGTMPAAGFANGNVALTVTGTDVAGNPVSANGSFQEDLVTPTATISLKHDAVDDTGSSAIDNLTNNVKPILVGTSDPNTAVHISVKDAAGNTFSYNSTTDASGNWSIDTNKVTATTGSVGSGLAEGLVSLTIAATDVAGNQAANLSSFTEDLTKPVAAISLKHDAADDTGVSSTDSLTSNAEPILVGTGEKNSTVQVTVVDSNKDTLTYTAATDSSGNWSIDTGSQAKFSGTMPRDGLSNGLVNLSVTSVDSAGNSATATNTFTIDIANHAADPTVSVSANGRWVFNEGSGTSTRDAYNSYTGTLTDLTPTAGGAAPTWITGHNGSAGTALNFDGKGGIVSVPLADTAALNGTSTLSAWFKTTQVGAAVGWSSPSIIGSEHQGDANDIQWGSINNKGQIGLGLGNDANGVYSTAAVNDGNWHDLTITRTVNADGTSAVSVYVDGAPSSSATLAAQVQITNGVPYNELAGFGYTNAWSGTVAAPVDGTAGDVYYKGALDDAAIYNHALTADQAKAVYTVENGYEGQAVANVGDPIKLAVTDTNATALHVIGVESGMTLTDGTHTITSTGNSQLIDVTGWNLGSLQLTNAGTGSATLEFDAINTTAAGQTEDTSTYLSVVNGTSLLGGTAGNDTLTATTGNATFISGGAGNDTITGGAGNDHLIGGAGNDVIVGGAGNDVIEGGSGNDTLTGGAGNDVFRWELADHGTAGAPNVATITDFSSVAGNKDMLDLRDLLPGANHDGTQTGNIANYVHFDLSGTDTVIHISTTGGFSNGYTAAAENETIVLKNVDLTSAGSQNDLQIIHQLLGNGQLHLG